MKPSLDLDDAPELTAAFFERADLYEGDQLVRRGRPKLETPKRQVTLRLDAEVVQGLRATGPSPRPPLRWSRSGSAYNGHTPIERNSTGVLANWLKSIGCMARPETCSICGAPARYQHAEDTRSARMRRAVLANRPVAWGAGEGS